MEVPGYFSARSRIQVLFAKSVLLPLEILETYSIFLFFLLFVFFNVREHVFCYSKFEEASESVCLKACEKHTHKNGLFSA